MSERKENEMDNFTDERDLELLMRDKYTFFVMRRVLDQESNILFSDHEKIILCYTGVPYPVWIWTDDGADAGDMDRAYELAKDKGFLDGKHSFNIKYELADHFIRRAEADGLRLAVKTNMFAYDCPDPVAPSSPAPGQICKAGPDDIEELVEIMDRFTKEAGLEPRDREAYFADAKVFIGSGNTYFWKDSEGNNVACCKYTPNGDISSINLVYTRPEHRRMHYAQNLVYQVTMKVKQEGYIPMLYTDADYAASNACYEKIGYVLRGKLCTIG